MPVLELYWGFSELIYIECLEQLLECSEHAMLSIYCVLSALEDRIAGIQGQFLTSSEPQFPNLFKENTSIFLVRIVWRLNEFVSRKPLGQCWYPSKHPANVSPSSSGILIYWISQQTCNVCAYVSVLNSWGGDRFRDVP